MVLDSKFLKLKRHFGIVRPEDWQSVQPAWVLSQDGVGPVTLDHLRIYLAARNLTLKDDRTPEYWQQNLSATKIGNTLGDDDDGPDRGMLCPFAVFVDTGEQLPYTFQGMWTDASEGNRPLIVPTERVALGRHPDSLGDYSLTGGIGRCHVERKSMDDAHGTILGFSGGRRDRFESELANLAQLEQSLVIVECSFEDLIARAPTTKKPAATNAKILLRSVISFQQDFRNVHWHFAGGRRLAENYTFRFLERWWRKQSEMRKETEKEAAKERQVEHEAEIAMAGF